MLKFMFTAVAKFILYGETVDLGLQSDMSRNKLKKKDFHDKARHHDMGRTAKKKKVCIHNIML